VGKYILENVQIQDGVAYNVNACIGYAGWSRTQLLGEMSRRHWLVGRSQIGDFDVVEGLWERIHDSGRCIIARHSEFVKDDFDEFDDEEESN